ncbi:MAG: acetyl-CoA carboxylase biotin carboxylase subunit [Chloroflexi bacterium]|nr:acetyl-CoA carboxylase biotin carboxylase subunit [Chloroflexota bacterium]
MFKKVLVANRGEIAVRILRACEELGIATVAVYSDADRNSLHVRYADEAYHIGPAPARESYLRIDRIIRVARESGAEAVHPGYGFLAENAAFARACTEADIVFVGPSAEVMRAMGDKLLARRTMRDAGVPVVPGIYEGLQSEKQAAVFAKELGYPVLIKASAGGGGKGMRAVRQRDELSSALRAAANESAAAFGDNTIYVEKMLEGVRHVEIQLLADRFGNIIHLGERECSIQRRHQKLIEEAPSTALNDELREEMGRVAVKAAAAVGYESAGTVEFLLDKDKNFYFLEMNTRLQVEHPVTEMVTGVDIPTEQLRIATGRKLRYKQEDIRMNGWAIECRISSEDPYNNFMPSVGRITRVYEPSGPGVRVDSGVFGGFEVSLFYDPLVAKLIVWGETRGQAILRMRRALSEYKIVGIQTSIPFHLRMMGTASFIGGRFDTSFLDRQNILTTDETSEHGKVAAVAAALVAYRSRKNSIANNLVQCGPDGGAWKAAARREVLRPR